MAPKFNLNQGFDEYIYKPPAYYFGATDSAFELSIYKALRRVAEGPLAGPLVFQHYYQDAAVLGGAAAEWLAQDPPEPFFLFVHFMDSHDPYFEIPYSGRGVARVRNPTPKVDDIPVLLNFYGQEARYIDEQVKSLLARLAASGRYERSIVALTADHGEEFHEHGSWWHGTSLYEEQVRVPLVIKRPDVAMAGQRRDDIARTIDIAPTVLNAAGLEALDSHQGVDLFTSGVDEPLFAEEELKGYKLQSIRTGPWKLITANPDNDRGQAPLELYNLDEDPGEQNNLAAEETLRLEQMEQQLRAFHAEIARD
jgi:arylsulfatase